MRYDESDKPATGQPETDPAERKRAIIWIGVIVLVVAGSLIYYFLTR